MRTLALRGGGRVAVVAAEWRDAFGVVVRGRVQLELRDGEPGPVLERDAGFWLHGTGVRALRNPGHRTAKVRIITPKAKPGTPKAKPSAPEARPGTLKAGPGTPEARTGTPGAGTGIPQVRAGARRSAYPHAPHRTVENDMNSTNDTALAAGPVPGRTRRFLGLVGTGLVATLVAMVVTTLAAALAQALGVVFEIPDGGETIPLPGFAVVTGLFSVVGVVIAVALLRWSARPAERFGWTAVALTAISLVPPFLVGAATTTVIALLGLHLVPAAVMIPTLTRSLRARTA
ncbi:DUF6069 family protein [Streptosporangium saharense]|uniref:DUF6069 family protein n=1 Tax=Streptosporangium saharense TaxID=1706840 RepID=UPI0034305477